MVEVRLTVVEEVRLAVEKVGLTVVGGEGPVEVRQQAVERAVATGANRTASR